MGWIRGKFRVKDSRNSLAKIYWKRLAEMVLFLLVMEVCALLITIKPSSSYERASFLILEGTIIGIAKIVTEAGLISLVDTRHAIWGTLRCLRQTTQFNVDRYV